MSKTIENLNQVLADSTVLYQKLRHYHWHVRGELFFGLHEQFENLYTEMADHIDAVAERTLYLEGSPLHTLAHVLEMTSLKEDPSIPDATTMVRNLVADFQALDKIITQAIGTAEGADDRSTVNLLDSISDALQNHIWMLKAWLK